MPPVRPLSPQPAPGRGGRRSRAPRVTRRSWAGGAPAEALGTVGRGKHKLRPAWGGGPGRGVRDVGEHRCWVFRRQQRGPQKSWRCRAASWRRDRARPHFPAEEIQAQSSLGSPTPTMGLREGERWAPSKQCPQLGNPSSPALQTAPSYPRTSPFKGLAGLRCILSLPTFNRVSVKMKASVLILKETAHSRM